MKKIYWRTVNGAVNMKTVSEKFLREKKEWGPWRLY